MKRFLASLCTTVFVLGLVTGALAVPYIRVSVEPFPEAASMLLVGLGLLGLGSFGRK